MNDLLSQRSACARFAAVSLAAVAFLAAALTAAPSHATADATFSTTFSSVALPGGHLPKWEAKTLGAIIGQSQVLANKWRQFHVDSAYWDVGGIPVYIGTPSQLTQMNQGAWVQYMEANCYLGIHVYRFKPEPPPFGYLLATRPKIIILTAATWSTPCRHKFTEKSDEVTLSHEVLETLVDPKANEFNQATFRRINGHGVEVCDPVEHHSYYDTTDGVWLSDFVLPSYYKEKSRGPYDYRGVLRRPWPHTD